MIYLPWLFVNSYDYYNCDAIVLSISSLSLAFLEGDWSFGWLRDYSILYVAGFYLDLDAEYYLSDILNDCGGL